MGCCCLSRKAALCSRPCSDSNFHPFCHQYFLGLFWLGQEKQVRQELLSLVDPSRKDDGCLNYDLHQALDKPSHFLFHENWTSEAQLERHLQKPELQAVLARLGSLVAEPPQIDRKSTR